MKDSKFKATFKSVWLPVLIVGVALIVFYKTIDRLPNVFDAIGSFIGILTPIIIGLVIAFLLYRPVSKLEKTLSGSNVKILSSHARGISVLICYFTLLVIIGVVLYLVIPKLAVSVVSLIDSLPKYYASVMEFISSKAGADGKILGFNVETIKSYFNVEKIVSYFDFSLITKYAGEIFKATGAVIDFFLSVVISVYMLLGKEQLISTFGRLIKIIMPENKFKSFKSLVFRSTEIFNSYIYSQLVDAVVVAAICTVVFSLAKIPYAFLLAILMGLCNLVPYFGALIGGFGVVLTTVIATGDFVKGIIALVLVIGAQQLDANIIQPKIVANTVGLKPIYVLVAITIGSGLFGFTGIILAVPIVAIIKMLLVEYVERKEKTTKFIDESLKQ